MDLWLHSDSFLSVWVRIDGEPEGAYSVGGNSLPKALNRKIHAALCVNLAVGSLLTRPWKEGKNYLALATFGAGFAGGVGRVPTTGFVGSTGAAPRAAIAASRFAVAAATAAL